MRQTCLLLIRGTIPSIPAPAKPILRTQAGLPFTGTLPLDTAFTSGDLYFFPMDKGVSNLSPCFMEIFPDRTPRHPDDSTRLLLLQPVQVDQFQQFELFRKEDNRVIIGNITLGRITSERCLVIHPSRYSRSPPASYSSSRLIVLQCPSLPVY